MNKLLSAESAVGDALQASMVLFTGIEHALRATTALGAYHKARSKGIPQHNHCPYGCEHPQPFVYNDMEHCGRCFYKYGELTPMTPCAPELCDE